MSGAAIAQSDEPGAPISFYGEASFADGSSLQEGTTIVAVVDDEEVVDSITVGSDGVYATDDPDSEKLRTDTNAGDTVNFHIEGVDGPVAEETHDIGESGVFEQDLTFAAEDVAESINLEVGGESGSVTLEEGSTTDATVTATFADGSSEDVTDQVTLTSSDTDVVSIDGSSVNADSTGDATVSTEYQGISDSIDVNVEAEPDTGGGGGGGQPADDDDGEATDGPPSKSIALAGTNPTVRIDAGQSISMIGFGSQVELTDTVTVTEVTESPSPAPQGATFVTGAEITFGSSNGEDVDTVQMGVQQTRLDELGVSSNQLVLHHLNEDGEWEALETEVVSEDKFEVVLEAPSAGFSTYAVFAQEDVTTTTQQPTTTEAPTTTAAPTTTEDPTTTEAPGDDGPGALLIGGIIVVVLALIAALYLAFGRE
ncbi:PGF-pre-PGF domain-containing protein [Halanaeroarchaeum sp. HSR-CO]|uniref:PGF-pre-PGF domain-containing protein n=1 Tax=Halanaeroarchaeum sp. HSR-CO TaxID=2866382 RepID=UPI00217DC6EF|nr:PGF-pre-PGF domain-containing protein [Halanaeroarchaeum sp. HSR-CO]